MHFVPEFIVCNTKRCMQCDAKTCRFIPKKVCFQHVHMAHTHTLSYCAIYFMVDSFAELRSESILRRRWTMDKSKLMCAHGHIDMKVYDTTAISRKENEIGNNQLFVESAYMQCTSANAMECYIYVCVYVCVCHLFATRRRILVCVCEISLRRINHFFHHM